MERFPYRDPDRAFGQIMLTLRSALGLTQAALAAHLGVSRRAVGDWEAGNKYPSAEHLKEFIALAVQQGAFSIGSEPDEIRALWRATHQRVPLDETWLASVLLQRAPTPALVGQQQHTWTTGAVAPGQKPVQSAGNINFSARTSGAPEALAPISSPTSPVPRVDWGSAPSTPHFYGRKWELDVLTEWVVKERCRVVSVLGLGGIGKSALAVSLMHRIAEQFEVVIWRSLRDASTMEALLHNLLQTHQRPGVDTNEARLSLGLGGYAGFEQDLNAVLERFRQMRILLVLDNLEFVLAEDEGRGVYHQGGMQSRYEALGRFLQRVAETEHRSCVLLTSREKPGVLVPQEGSHSPVRALRVARLDGDACEALLAEKGVKGTAGERARLTEAYAGNPLALIFVSQTIIDLFNGEPSLFLEQGETIYGGVRQLLSEQFRTLSELERCLLTWLAIMREPTTLHRLRSMLVTPARPEDLLDAVEGLHHRNLIEPGMTLGGPPGSFVLQPVVLEYVTTVLISEASEEIRDGRLNYLIKYRLEQAHATDYARETQESLLIAALLAHLRATSRGHSSVEAQLIALLDRLRRLPEDAQGYGPLNLLALLREHRGDLHGIDLSGLAAPTDQPNVNQ